MAQARFGCPGEVKVIISSLAASTSTRASPEDWVLTSSTPCPIPFWVLASLSVKWGGVSQAQG